MLGVAGIIAMAVSASAAPLSRAEAVARALAANPTVTQSREDLAILDGRVREAMADAFPDVSLIGAASRYRDPSLLNTPGIDELPAELRRGFAPQPSELFDGAVQVKQTLFRFGLSRSIVAARMARDWGGEQVDRSRQLVALDAVRAYNALLLYDQLEAVARDSVSHKEAHLEMARTRRDAGVATDLDVLRSEVDIGNERAQLRRAEGLVDLARGQLNAIMVRPIDEAIEPTDSLAALAVPAELAPAIRDALARRPEMKGIALEQSIRAELVKIARAGALPRLDLTGAYGFSARRADDLGDPDFSRWSVAVTLAVPIFDGLRTASQVAQAEAEQRKVAAARQELENRIRLEVKDAVDRLRVAGSIVEAAELNVKQANRLLEMTQANYGLGAATTLDVLDAQAALTLASSIRLQALYEHANARAALRHATGLDPLEPAADGVSSDRRDP